MATEDYKEKIIALFNDKTLPQEKKQKLEEIFPELKESDGEKIRRELIAYLRNNSVYVGWSGLDVKKAIEWLEKQGESAPEQEPNFKVGDWIINKTYHDKVQIKDFGENGKVWFDDGTVTFIEFVNECYRLWSPQDAKQGDF